MSQIGGNCDAVSWHDVWERVADDLGGWGARGMGHLLTEDVLRFATIRHLIDLGAPAGSLQIEWRRPGSRDAVDLALGAPERGAVEFKFPREPRPENAAWTTHLGELLKDYYRLASMPEEFEERWIVQLLPQGFRDYLRRFEGRHEQLRLPEAEGAETVLDPVLLTSLPLSVSVLMDRWADQDLTVRARCVESRPVGDELLLLVHAVEPIALAG